MKFERPGGGRLARVAVTTRAGEPVGLGRPDRGPVGRASPVDRLVGAVADDPAVTEIMINGPGPVWVERRGLIERTECALDANTIDVLVESIVGPLGLRVDRASPIVDARLADGSRVNVVVPPLAVNGPIVSIRRFARAVLPLSSFGPPDLVRVLSGLVAGRASVLVVGPTSSGKTSLVATLVDQTDPGDRVVCLEDTAELPLDRDNLVRLEARPPNSEGVGEVPLRRLVLTALRMRPDRLVVGEVRGAEAFDLLLALTSGHRGCLATCHAPDAAEGLRRLETLAALAGPRLGPARLGRLVVDGIDAVVVTGTRRGRRGVIEVAAVDRDGGLRRLWPTLSPVSPAIPLDPASSAVRSAPVGSAVGAGEAAPAGRGGAVGSAGAAVPVAPASAVPVGSAGAGRTVGVAALADRAAASGHPPPVPSDLRSRLMEAGS